MEKRREEKGRKGKKKEVEGRKGKKNYKEMGQNE
jgi:hypothetical protein